jgi:hypothetical protein
LGSGNWPNLDELLEPEKSPHNNNKWQCQTGLWIPFHNAKQGNCFLAYRTNPWLLIGWILVSIVLTASAPATPLFLFLTTNFSSVHNLNVV